MWRSWSLYCLIVIIVALCIAQDDPDGDPCNNPSSQLSCDACISASSLCSWCPYDPNVTVSGGQRCRLSTSPCPADVMPENPQPKIRIIKDEPLSNVSSFDAVQVSPQNISLELRRGTPASFNMTFRSLRNSPLDVYFLLDISSSQGLVLTTLQTDLRTIADTLDEVSSDFTMGFGAFVDKPTLPYALDDYRFNNTLDPSQPFGLNCRTLGVCEPTYSFRNYQSLSNDIDEIGVNINNSAVASNIDATEGALEALLQTAICTNETGWRPNALHIVFLITDQTYHIAGDGRAAGIVQPNDGLCHLEPGFDGDANFLEYTFALVQDYPSLYQVRTALEENLIVPIFALRESSILESLLRPAYDRLAADFDSTQAQVVTFDDESRDEILAAIRESYDRTVQTIRVNSPNVPGYSFNIEPVAGCANRTEDTCMLQFDEEVTFEVTVTLDDCVAAGNAVKQVQLLGPPFSFSTIDLVSLCECQCSMEEPEIESGLCNVRGSLQCGLCDCDVGEMTYFGDQCECDEVISECPTGDSSATCSGNGECTSCGTCRCTVLGTFGGACQCNASSCPRSCGAGQCNCDNVNLPPTCACDNAPLSGFPFFDESVDRPCVCNPDNCYNENFPDELCHSEEFGDGRDFCGCNGCFCPPDLSPTRERICILATELCDVNEDCTRCRIGDVVTAEGEDRNCTGCNPSEITELVISADIPADEDTIQECEYVFQGCVFTLYIQLEDGVQIFSYFRDCGTTTLPWIIAGSLVGAIIVLGLLFLIILKLLLLFCDRIEYKKFTHELKEADFAPHENPLYLTPQQDYENPIRRKTSKRLSEQQEQEQQ